MNTNSFYKKVSAPNIYTIAKQLTFLMPIIVALITPTAGSTALCTYATLSLLLAPTPTSAIKQSIQDNPESKFPKLDLSRIIPSYLNSISTDNPGTPVQLLILGEDHMLAASTAGVRQITKNAVQFLLDANVDEDDIVVILERAPHHKNCQDLEREIGVSVIGADFPLNEVLAMTEKLKSLMDRFLKLTPNSHKSKKAYKSIQKHKTEMSRGPRHEKMMRVIETELKKGKFVIFVAGAAHTIGRESASELGVEHILIKPNDSSLTLNPCGNAFNKHNVLEIQVSDLINKRDTQSLGVARQLLKEMSQIKRNWRFYLKSGDLEISSKSPNYIQAVRHFHEATSMNPDSFQAWEKLMLTIEKLKKLYLSKSQQIKVKRYIPTNKVIQDMLNNAKQISELKHLFNQPDKISELAKKWEKIYSFFQKLHTEL